MGTVAIAAEIKTLMEAVSGIGVVYDWERFNKQAEPLVKLFTSSGIINGWTITWEEDDEQQYANHEVERITRFVIRGYYEMDDEQASSKTFDGLVEGVKDTLRAQKSLSGTARRTFPPVTRKKEIHRIGSREAHYCEIVYNVQQDIEVTYID